MSKLFDKLYESYELYLLEYSDKDAWIDTKGNIYYLGKFKTHSEWLLNNVDKFDDRLKKYYDEELRDLESAAVKLGWIRLGATLGTIEAVDKQTILDNASVIDKYFKQHGGKTARLQVDFGRDFATFSYSDYSDYGIRKILTNTRQFEIMEDKMSKKFDRLYEFYDLDRVDEDVKNPYFENPELMRKLAVQLGTPTKNKIRDNGDYKVLPVVKKDKYNDEASIFAWNNGQIRLENFPGYKNSKLVWDASKVKKFINDMKDEWVIIRQDFKTDVIDVIMRKKQGVSLEDAAKKIKHPSLKPLNDEKLAKQAESIKTIKDAEKVMFACRDEAESRKVDLRPIYSADDKPFKTVVTKLGKKGHALTVYTLDCCLGKTYATDGMSDYLVKDAADAKSLSYIMYIYDTIMRGLEVHSWKTQDWSNPNG